LCSLWSCSDDWLETTPLVEATEGNFYRTPGDAYTALVGCYDGLQVVWAGGTSFPVATTVLSDEGFGGGGMSDALGYIMLDEFDKSKSPSELNLYADNWAAYYAGVYRCNVLLNKMDQIDWNGNET